MGGLLLWKCRAQAINAPRTKKKNSGYMVETKKPVKLSESSKAYI
jgi:hypothetical protein